MNREPTPTALPVKVAILPDEASVLETVRRLRGIGIMGDGLSILALAPPVGVGASQGATSVETFR